MVSEYMVLSRALFAKSLVMLGMPLTCLYKFLYIRLPILYSGCSGTSYIGEKCSKSLAATATIRNPQCLLCSIALPVSDLVETYDIVEEPKMRFNFSSFTD